jgi:RNA polymerase sigma-70 factor (ECF subfamily)
MTGPGEIERLYRSHGGLVLRRARAILGNEADAREALQDVFAELVRAPRSLDGVRSVVGWLYRATTHRCLKMLRDRRSGARLLRRHAAGSRQALAVAGGELAVEVRSLLATLPDEEAAALVYHHVDGMSHAEVAELLGCSPRKVGYLLERAHGVLLQEEEGPV